MNCLICGDPAVYIRYTQFAGDHPLCEKHAQEDKDFMIETSYTSWEKIDDVFAL
jgi:hypothetical protein